MDEWDPLFDESYFRFYGEMLDDERARREAEGAIRLAGVEPGAEVLDCPCGFPRHAAVLAALGCHVTGVDRSEAQLAEARRRLGETEWPRLVRADFRELPFADDSFDAALTSSPRSGTSTAPATSACSTSCVGSSGRADASCSRRCTGTASPASTGRASGIRCPTARSSSRRIFDQVAGTVATTYRILGSDEPVERRFVHRLYTPCEWDAMLAEAGFQERLYLGGWNDEPLSTDTRLIAVATA